ncbi:MAG TPA: YdcF family protein [Acidobacteriaceae bacterium]|nr:YdcF family protein [Acidobacteriaceae bacterium]
MRKLAWWTFFWFAVFAALWFLWVFQQIRTTEVRDQAAPSDAIAVFGAAEYNGRPSPVLRARLDHALDLYQQGIAPIIITLGGGTDSQSSEGEVGRDYLLANGVPDSHIIAETASNNTEQSVEHLAAIARENHFQRIVVVSDGTHLFRIRELCRAQGLLVLCSPRPVTKPVDLWDQVQRYVHEMGSYTLWRLHLH